MLIKIWNCLWFEGNCYVLVFGSNYQLVDIGQYNFCFGSYSYILVQSLGLGFGLGFNETFEFGFWFYQNRKSGFVCSLIEYEKERYNERKSDRRIYMVNVRMDCRGRWEERDRTRKSVRESRNSRSIIFFLTTKNFQII